MLDMVALGLIAPVLPNLILGFVNNDMARTAIWNGIFLTVFAAMQFFFSPVIGVLSDRFHGQIVHIGASGGEVFSSRRANRCSTTRPHSKPPLSR